MAELRRVLAGEEVFALLVDECLEFQLEATSWGQGCVGMEVGRSCLSGGGDSLGKCGMHEFKKQNVYQKAREGEKV